MKELFIGLPIYTTFVVLDEAEKNKGLCILDSVPERVQTSEEFLKYHKQCMNKLVMHWRDNIKPKQR